MCGRVFTELIDDWLALNRLNCGVVIARLQGSARVIERTHNLLGHVTTAQVRGPDGISLQDFRYTRDRMNTPMLASVPGVKEAVWRTTADSQGS